MNIPKRDFDSKSAQWDSNPTRVKMAYDVVDAIMTSIPLNSAMEIMDFGCGTGLLSTQLSYLVKSVTSIDSSKGMLSVVEQKIERDNLKNIHTIHVDLEQGDRLSGMYVFPPKKGFPYSSVISPALAGFSLPELSLRPKPIRNSSS